MATHHQAAAGTQVDVRGPRFTAWVTTVVLVVALITAAFSAPAAAGILGVQAVVFAAGFFALGLIATALALAAAFLNAAFGICLGCQLYPFVVRLRRTDPTPA